MGRAKQQQKSPNDAESEVDSQNINDHNLAIVGKTSYIPNKTSTSLRYNFDLRYYEEFRTLYRSALNGDYKFQRRF